MYQKLNLCCTSNINWKIRKDVLYLLYKNLIISKNVKIKWSINKQYHIVYFFTCFWYPEHMTAAVSRHKKVLCPGCHHNRQRTTHRLFYGHCFSGKYILQYNELRQFHTAYCHVIAEYLALPTYGYLDKGRIVFSSLIVSPCKNTIAGCLLSF